MTSEKIIQKGTAEALVFCAHMDPTHLVAGELKDNGATATVAAMVLGAGTSVYRGYVQARGGWDAWVGKIAASAGVARPTKTALVCWSAGGQVAKDVCVDARGLPDAIVLCDAVYGSKPAGAKQGDGKVVVDDALRALARYMASAARGERTCVLTYSAIATPYASSSEVATKLRELIEDELGFELPTAHDVGLSFEAGWGLNGLTILADTGRDGPEHIREAKAFDDLLVLHVPWAFSTVHDTDPSPAEPAPPSNPQPGGHAFLSLGERCVRWCEAEMAAGVREEPPGSNTSPRIAWYLAPAYRRETGAILGIKAAPWCAAAQCAAQRECLLPGEAGSHGYYASGLELEQGARAVGTWRGPGYVPEVGDVVILKRVGSDAATAAWQRHVARVRTVPGDGTFTTIGGNEGDRWNVATRRLIDPAIVGFIAYPQRQPLDAA